MGKTKLQKQLIRNRVSNRIGLTGNTHKQIYFHILRCISILSVGSRHENIPNSMTNFIGRGGQFKCDVTEMTYEKMMSIVFLIWEFELCDYEEGELHRAVADYLLYAITNIMW